MAFFFCVSVVVVQVSYRHTTTYIHTFIPAYIVDCPAAGAGCVMFLVVGVRMGEGLPGHGGGEDYTHKKMFFCFIPRTTEKRVRWEMTPGMLCAGDGHNKRGGRRSLSFLLSAVLPTVNERSSC